MKTLICFIFISLIFTSVKAADPGGDIKINFPKKVSGLNDIQENACDLCGCYMGLDPNYSYNQVGLRYHTFKFHSDAHSVNEPQTDHESNGSESNEYYNSIELYGRYYFTPKIKLLFSIPFSFNEIDNKQLNGAGDAKIFLQYQLYNTNIDRNTKFWQRFFLGGGVKLPTGVYNKTFVYGQLEPHFQPGTGSYDLIFSANHLMKFIKSGIGLSTDVIYSLNGENKNDYRFANRFNVTSTAFYEITASQFTILPHAGVYFEHANYDKQSGNIVDDSGGDALFATGGTDFYYKSYSLDLTFQLPVSQSLNGDQPQNEFRIFAGVGYSF
ncbi:MAG: hypothetical protein JSS91_11180 [Bacteroidetes bacterium]|nr:hypothetical protein [Bacteroidota bacterium]